MTSDQSDSALGQAFGFVGLLAGLAVGVQTQNCFALVICVLVFVSVGIYVGTKVEAFLVRAAFVVASIIGFLVNGMIRNAIVDLVTQAFK